MAENTPLTLLARVDILPGFEAEIKAAASTLGIETRKESGCIAFYVNFEKDKPVITFYEIYRSADDFEAHKTAPYTQCFFNIIQGKVVGNAPALTYLEQVVA